MCGWLRLEMARASRSKRARDLGRLGEVRAGNLDRDRRGRAGCRGRGTPRPCRRHRAESGFRRDRGDTRREHGCGSDSRGGQRARPSRATVPASPAPAPAPQERELERSPGAQPRPYRAHTRRQGNNRERSSGSDAFLSCVMPPRRATADSADSNPPPAGRCRPGIAGASSPASILSTSTVRSSCCAVPCANVTTPSTMARSSRWGVSCRIVDERAHACVSELLARGIQRLGYAVADDDECVARGEVHHALLIGGLGKRPDDGAPGLETGHRGSGKQQWRDVSRVAVDQHTVG